IALVDGSGWLAAPAAGTEYPLVSAKRALDALPAPPRILIACATPAVADCPMPRPVVVTGARPGLTLRYQDRGGPLLAPAWLYDVRGGGFPPAAVAIDPAYLG